MSRPGERWSRRRKTAPKRSVKPLPSRFQGGVVIHQTRKDAGIRHELVNRVRYEIAAGVYDTPAKFECALERMLDRFAEG